jgi:hypothetical protein
MAIYYHETIDASPKREKEVEYLEQLGEVVERLVNMPGNEMRCVANWTVVWCTGRWPEVVGQWEMTWDWFLGHFRDYQLTVDHPEGYEQYRSGGFDRLLIPWEGTPDLDTITSQGLRAPWILQETVQLAPGGAPPYLEALAKAAVPLASGEQGCHLHGSYNVLLRNDSEVIVQWAFADLDSLAATWRDPGSNAPLREWRRTSQELERSHVGVLLKPTEWSALR